MPEDPWLSEPGLSGDMAGRDVVRGRIVREDPGPLRGNPTLCARGRPPVRTCFRPEGSNHPQHTDITACACFPSMRITR